jgi:fructose-specific phosphotransferase system IIC component
MITIIIVGAVCLAAGFAVGRIKNAAKLEKIQQEIGSVDHYVGAEARTLFLKIKAHL